MRSHGLDSSKNFGVHGIEPASGVTFALGGTFLNIIMIFIVLPLKQAAQKVFGHA
jgi:hypothetical protein